MPALPNDAKHVHIKELLMMDDRLRAIETRARALGWNDWDTFATVVQSIVDMIAWPDFGASCGEPDWLTAAERLLTAYEPVTGPVVEIGTQCGEFHCGLGHESMGFDCCALDFEIEKNKPVVNSSGFQNTETWYEPDPDKCPGPGTYRLVRCDDKEDSDE